MTTYATLNPLDKSSDIILSGGNLVADHTNGVNAYDTVRATIGLSSGKWYWEVTRTKGATNYGNVGVLSAAGSLDDGVGNAATGWCTDVQMTVQGHCHKRTNSSNTDWGPGIDDDDVICIALDMDAGKIWFGKNGTWFESGDPAAGTGEAFSGLSGTLYPAISIYSSDDDTFTANFGESAFTGSVPSGFNSGVYSAPSKDVDAAIVVSDILSISGTMQEGLDGDTDAKIEISLTILGTMDTAPCFNAAMVIPVVASGTMTHVQAPQINARIDLLDTLTVTGAALYSDEPKINAALNLSNVLSISGTLMRVSGGAVDADLFDNMEAELYPGALGNEAALRLNGMSVAGTALVGPVGDGSEDRLRFSLAVAGNATAYYSSATGELSFILALAGAATATAIGDGQGLAIKMSMEGTGVSGVSVTVDLEINSMGLAGSSYQVPHGNGSLTISFELDGHIFTETYKCIVMNVKNFAVTEYDWELNSMAKFNGVYLGAAKTRIYEMMGTTDNGTSIPWSFKTGKIDLEDNIKTRLRHAWVSYRPSGDLILTVDDGDNEYEYDVESYRTDSDGGVRVKLGKGFKNRFIQLKLANRDDQTIFLDRLRLFTEPIKKAR